MLKTEIKFLNYSWLFLIVILIGCKDVEEISKDKSILKSKLDLSEFFINYLEKNKDIADIFYNQLEDDYPFYEYVDLKTTNSGPVFVIPYGNTATNKVKGLTLFPIEYQFENNNIKLGEKLEEPLFINKENIEQKFSIPERYLFSDFFDNFQREGLYVDTCLTRYLSLTNCPMIFENPYEKLEYGINTSYNPILSSRSTSSYKYRIKVFNYTIQTYSYYNNNEVTICSASPQTLKNVFYQTIDICHASLLNVFQYSKRSFYFDIVLRDPNVLTFINKFRDLLYQKYRLNITLSFSFTSLDRITPTPPNIPAPQNKGSETYYAGVQDKEKDHIPDLEDLCKKLKDKNGVKNPIKDIKKVWDTKSKHDDYTNSESMDAYLDSIKKYNSSREVLITYQVGDKNQEASLKNMEIGDHYSVPSRTMSALTQWVIHSHPSDGVRAPSPQDFLNFLEYSSDKYYQNYKGEIIVNYSTDNNRIYILEKGENTTGIEKIYNIINNSIDPQTHDFKSGSIIDRTLKSIKSGSIEERLIKSYTFLNDMYGNNNAFTLSSLDFKDKELDKASYNGYSLYKGLSKKKKIKYIIIKCND